MRDEKVGTDRGFVETVVQTRYHYSAHPSREGSRRPARQNRSTGFTFCPTWIRSSRRGLAFWKSCVLYYSFVAMVTHYGSGRIFHFGKHHAVPRWISFRLLGGLNFKGGGWRFRLVQQSVRLGLLQRVEAGRRLRVGRLCRG